jgi:hypothetical protein
MNGWNGCHRCQEDVGNRPSRLRNTRGVPPEELEDDDLSEAMQELSIPDVEADPSELS